VHTHSLFVASPHSQARRVASPNLFSLEIHPAASSIHHPPSHQPRLNYHDTFISVSSITLRSFSTCNSSPNIVNGCTVIAWPRWSPSLRSAALRRNWLKNLCMSRYVGQEDLNENRIVTDASATGSTKI
jgi:hypothetical protein